MKNKTGMHRMPDGTMMKGEKHGYNYGGMAGKKKKDYMAMGMSKGGMTAKKGYNKGGYCGASNPAERPMMKKSS